MHPAPSRPKETCLCTKEMAFTHPARLFLKHAAGTGLAPVAALAGACEHLHGKTLILGFRGLKRTSSRLSFYLPVSISRNANSSDANSSDASASHDGSSDAVANCATNASWNRWPCAHISRDQPDTADTLVPVTYLYLPVNTALHTVTAAAE